LRFVPPQPSQRKGVSSVVVFSVVTSFVVVSSLLREGRVGDFEEIYDLLFEIYYLRFII